VIIKEYIYTRSCNT